MDGHGEYVAVSRIAVLHQVSVLVLGDDAGCPELPVALAVAVDGPSRIVVIDCLAIRRLGPSLREALVTAHDALDRNNRHLIVVNAPPDEVAPLREHGVDVAATTDQQFAGPASSDYSSQRQANTGCS